MSWLFNGIMVTMAAGAAISYVAEGHLWKAIYWTAAAVITVAVWNL